ncbi:glycosyltransferase family 4 protein [Aureliella helgolandensis]|uniref:Alpha-D-kanosaminyltransferase n=1 Tax=Aureliella helgolandensis TaxID=2527968 RepID=A0A518GFI6_9BACT|nr:glycosyltransferase family 4 protein [Aureliella helgolandensis]QDV27317.1 Alpha-D-kanosaminyltransferase [Aureliella helgolandensis]
MNASERTERQPHIVILVENLPVPFDRRVWMESLALTNAGYRISVVSPMAPDDEVANREIDGIHVYRYPPPALTRGKLSFIREFAYCYWQTRKLLAKIWQESKFDVIHSCNPPDTFWHIAKSYKTRGVKFVFDHHDLCPELYESKFDRKDFLYRALLWLEKKQFQTADGVIATNESYKRIAVARGGKEESDVAVVRSGPLLSRFERGLPVPELRRGREKLVVYLGVMGAQDGVDYALRAVRYAIDDGLKDTSFTFIGSGDEFDNLIRLTESLDLAGVVHFTGRISDSDLKQYMSTADLGIAPDPKNPLNDVSSMNKIVEYMAMELPLVSFDLVESRCTAGEAAVYVSGDSEQGMADAMRMLLSDPAKRQEMGRIGRARVEEMLAWDYSRQVLVDFYDKLLGRLPVSNSRVD